MISTGDIWLAQDALVYDTQGTHQYHCPLGLGLFHCSCTAGSSVQGYLISNSSSEMLASNSYFIYLNLDL